mgnify:CR=1 FL=1
MVKYEFGEHSSELLGDACVDACYHGYVNHIFSMARCSWAVHVGSTTSADMEILMNVLLGFIRPDVFNSEWFNGNAFLCRKQRISWLLDSCVDACWQTSASGS